MSQQNHQPGNTWWLGSKDAPTGPFSESFVLLGIKTGTTSPQTKACQVGNDEWKQLSDWPQFAAACLVAPATPVAREASPWNPEHIAWWGLVFSPLWVGVMTAINARRLKLSRPIWRPIIIAVVATFVDLALVNDRFTYSVLPDICLYLATLWWIWRVDLRPQCSAYESWSKSGHTAAPKFWAILAGVPLALFVLLAFVLGPFAPLEPRQVCERFVAASSLGAAESYTTLKFHPALAAMFAQKSDASAQPSFELTDEAEAAPDVCGYLVGYRLHEKAKMFQTDMLMEGLFHLKKFDGVWKIEDCYITSVGNQPVNSPVSIAVNYQTMFANGSGAKASAVSVSAGYGFTGAMAGWLTNRKASANPAQQNAFLQSGGHNSFKAFPLILKDKLNFAKIFKVIGSGLAALFLGLAGLGRYLRGGEQKQAAQADSSASHS